MKLLDYIVLIFIIIILFMAVACQASEDPCKDYRLEQNQKIDCTEDCVTIITTIEYCSQ
tara:strand:+ start:315 stop:491 length:177 start_codon:yes stop_codon:yes gene_type:complete